MNLMHGIINTWDPAGALKLRAQLEINIEAILVWIGSIDVGRAEMCQE